MTMPRHLLLLLTFTAATAAETDVLVRVGGAEIKIEDVRSSLETLDARQLAAVRENDVLLEQVVTSFIAQRMVLQQAIENQWDKEAEVVAKLQRAHDSTLTQSYLESVSQPPAHYPDDAELKAAYEQRRVSFLVPRAFRMAQIFVPVAKDADAKTQQQAKRALEASNSFVELGWLTENQIQPEIRTKLPALKSDVVSAPIRLDDGWHVLKVLEIRDSYTPTLDQVRAQLRVTLRNERLRENSQAYLERLLKDHPVTLDKAVLGKVLPTQAE